MAETRLNILYETQKRNDDQIKGLTIRVDKLDQSLGDLKEQMGKVKEQLGLIFKFMKGEERPSSVIASHVFDEISITSHDAFEAVIPYSVNSGKERIYEKNEVIVECLSDERKELGHEYFDVLGIDKMTGYNQLVSDSVKGSRVTNELINVGGHIGKAIFHNYTSHMLTEEHENSIPILENVSIPIKVGEINFHYRGDNMDFCQVGCDFSIPTVAIMIMLKVYKGESGRCLSWNVGEFEMGFDYVSHLNHILYCLNDNGDVPFDPGGLLLKFAHYTNYIQASDMSSLERSIQFDSISPNHHKTYHSLVPTTAYLIPAKSIVTGLGAACENWKKILGTYVESFYDISYLSLAFIVHGFHTSKYCSLSTFLLWKNSTPIDDTGMIWMILCFIRIWDPGGASSLDGLDIFMRL